MDYDPGKDEYISMCNAQAQAEYDHQCYEEQLMFKASLKLRIVTLIEAASILTNEDDRKLLLERLSVLQIQYSLIS
jgi:hypothetical protein